MTTKSTEVLLMPSQIRFILDMMMGYSLRDTKRCSAHNNVDATELYNHLNSHLKTMITQDDRNFVNMLFDKMITHTDMEEMDMSDDDTAGMMALELKAAELEVTVDELTQMLGLPS